MFIDGYYTYDNFMDAVTRSLQAVETALRERFNAGARPTFARTHRSSEGGRHCD